MDFGAFPGKAEASVAITGQGGIGTSNDAEAWIRCESSADHSAEEHDIEDFIVDTRDISAGTGFTVIVRPRVGRCYGVYNISWVWN